MESRIERIKKLTVTRSGPGCYDSMLSAALYNNEYSITAHHFSVDYKRFLNKYGWLEIWRENDRRCRWRIGTDICGDLEKDQDNFRKKCRESKHISKEDLKYCWKFATSGSTYYYFDFSEKAKGSVFSMSSDGKRMYADDFLGFLGRVIIDEDEYALFLVEESLADPYEDY